MTGCAIVGVTGLLASGKSTVVDMLSELADMRAVRVSKYSLSGEIVDLLRSFEHGEAAWASLSAELMANLQEDLNLGQLQSRENKVAVANELRRRYGGGVLAQRIVDRIAVDVDASSLQPTLIIVDSIRNPSEITRFRDIWRNKFRLLAVEAPADTIAARLVSRRRSDEDPKNLENWEGLLKMRQQDSGIGQPDWGLQVLACIQNADWRVINDGSIDHLMDDLRRFWDEVLVAVWHSGETSIAHEGS